MITRLRQNKGQSTLEYAVLVIVVIAAFVAMNSYMNRGVQGRIKSATDEIGDKAQFEAGNTNSIVAQKRVSKVQEQFGGSLGQGNQRTTIVGDELTNSISRSVIANST